MEYSRTRPLGSHTSRLVVPSFLPVIRSSLGDTATASPTTGSPIENRCSGPSYLRSEEHTSELQSRLHLVCRLLLEKKKKKYTTYIRYEKTPHEARYQHTRRLVC